MAVMDTKVPMGKILNINGIICRFSEGTTKRVRVIAALPPGGEYVFREANDEEKALTYPKAGD